MASPGRPPVRARCTALRPKRSHRRRQGRAAATTNSVSDGCAASRHSPPRRRTRGRSPARGARRRIRAALGSRRGMTLEDSPPEPGDAPRRAPAITAAGTLTGWLGALRVRQADDDARGAIGDLIPDGPGVGEFVLRFSALTTLSAAIAAFGLLADSGAVVIGAMLVAPLMTPILASAAATVTADNRLLARSVAILALGTLLAIAVGWAVGFIAAVHVIDVGALPDEIRSRTFPGLLDLGIAIAAGAAAGYIQPRRSAISALPGVGIAVALVPPLATVGITAELGARIRGPQRVPPLPDEPGRDRLLGGDRPALHGLSPEARGRSASAAHPAHHHPRGRRGGGRSAVPPHTLGRGRPPPGADRRAGRSTRGTTTSGSSSSTPRLTAISPTWTCWSPAAGAHRRRGPWPMRSATASADPWSCGCSTSATSNSR